MKMSYLRISLLIVGALAVMVLVLSIFHRAPSAEGQGGTGVLFSNADLTEAFSLLPFNVSPSVGQGSPKVLFTGADLQESFILERPSFLPASKRVQPPAEQTPTSASGFDGVFVLTLNPRVAEWFSGGKVGFSIGDLVAAESVELQPGAVTLLDLTASDRLDPSPAWPADSLEMRGGPHGLPHIIIGTAAVNGSRVPEGTLIRALVGPVLVTTAEIMAAPGEGASVSEQAPKTLEPLGDNLVRVWSFDSPTRSWSFFDPRPDLAAFNTITEFDWRHIYWVGVKEDQSVTLDGHNFDFYGGWNVVGGKVAVESVNTPTPLPTPTTSTPRPTSTPSPPPTPVPAKPVVNFHAETIETKPGQPVDISLAVVNLKTNPGIEVHVVLRAPPGLLLAGDSCPSVGQCSVTYELSSGGSSNMSVRATAKKPGQFTMEAQVTWRAKDGEPARMQESLAVTVVEPVNTPTPRPTSTPSPPSTPAPAEPVVNFHAETTETKPGQPVDISLAVVNLKTNPDIEVHVILRSPTGLLLAGDSCPSVAQCSDAYELSSGATNNMSVRATANDPGQFTMKAQVTWQVKDGEPAQLKESLALRVVELVAGETEVTLHATQTEVRVGEPLRLTLSAVNSIVKPPMKLILIIKAPSGWSVTGTGFAAGCGPQCTATYDLESGQLRHIDVLMVPNQPGDFEVEASMEWYFGGDTSTLERRAETVQVNVQGDPTPTPDTEASGSNRNEQSNPTTGPSTGTGESWFERNLDFLGMSLVGIILFVGVGWAILKLFLN